MEQASPVADRLSRDFRDELERNFDDFMQLNQYIVDSREEAKRFIGRVGQRLLPWYKRLCYYRVLDVFDTVPESPLNIAAGVGDIEIMKSLIAVGFDPHGRDQIVFATGCRDIYPIIWAAEKGTLESVKYLVEEQECNINVCDGFFRDTPLHKATKMGRLDIVKYLVEKGADMNAGNFLQHPPIMNALVFPDVCRYLLGQGADLSIMDKTDRPFLHYAILICQDINLIKAFLDAGASVTKTSLFDNMSPFGQAACFRKLDVMKLLYSRGADPETPDRYGVCPIHFAVRHLSTDMLHYLVVELNVSMDKKTEMGKTALQIALEDGKANHVKLLLEAGYKPTLDEIHSFDSDTDPMSKEMQDVMDLVKLVGSNAQSLQSLCCLKVRHILGITVQDEVDSLEIPNIVKDRVKLSHIHPVYCNENLPFIDFDEG